MGFDILALSQRNRGMGANFNYGIAAASGEFILLLQDDWECIGPRDYLRRAVGVMEARREVGMVICRPHPRRIAERSRPMVGADTVRIFANDPTRPVRAVGEHGYTDWPHLKRRAFVDAVGPYKGGHRMWETELDYARRVNAQTEYFVADIVGLDAFRHIGEELSYNRGPLTARISMALERYALGRHVVALARQLKRRLVDAVEGRAR
jgi:glycosyltransferase involved in cell wall biosynthesis